MEMLTFKEKKFDINDNFSDLLKKVDIYYNVYSDKLYNAEKAINNHIVSVNVEDNYVHLNDVEVIFYLDSLYDTLTYEGDGYKENAHFYKDFDLEEGQTYYKSNAVDVEFIPDNEDYKVSYLSALKIANKNLKDDFVKTYDGQVTNLSFEKYEVSQQDYEGDKYWYIKITKADISWYSDEDGALCDGELSGKELEKLQCMVNVNTGKYLHCPCEKN